MINTRYKNIKWTIPVILNNEIFIDSINNIITKFYQEENPIEALCYFGICTNIFEDFTSKNFSKNSLTNYNLQYIYQDLLIDNRIFNNKNFEDFLSFASKYQFSFITSNDFLLKFIINKYDKIKVIASEQKSRMDKITDNEIDYYEMLCKKYDKVILSPKYVKEDFFKQYKNFSDTSKFEIYVNYDDSKDIKKDIRNSFALTNDEIKRLIEEVGIKHFRLYGYNKNLSCIIEDFFRYIFYPEPETIYLFSKIINDYWFNKEYNSNILKGELCL